MGPFDRSYLPVNAKRRNSVANHRSETSITYGSRWDIFGGGIKFAILLLAFVVPISFIIYALSGVENDFVRVISVTLAVILQLITIFLFLGQVLKTVQVAELTDHRLKINTVLREIDIPVEAIQDLVPQRYENVEVLKTRDGDFIFIYRKPGDRLFAESLRRYTKPQIRKQDNWA